MFSRKRKNTETEATPKGVLFDFTEKKFPGQQDDEKVFYFVRRHWITIVPRIIFDIILITIIVLITIFLVYPSFADIEAFSELFVIFAIVSAITVIFHIMFVSLLNYFLDIIIVTNNRIVDMDYTVLFRRNQFTLSYNQIQDIQVEQSGILRVILNYGDIIIDNASTEGKFKLCFIPRPKYHFDNLNRFSRQAEQRGEAANHDTRPELEETETTSV